MRVLVVDDSALYRKTVRTVLEGIPGVKVVDTAFDGQAALEKIETYSPDLITLDFEMPNLDGLGVLRELQTKKEKPMVIMVSALTTQGARVTNQALRHGAFDFVLKPSGGNYELNQEQLRADLVPVIEACRSARRHQAAPSPVGRQAVPAGPSDHSLGRMHEAVKSICEKPSIVGIGVSTGGPVALTKVLPMLPEKFPVPIVVVQHMPPIFTKSLAEDLDNRCKLEVKEASDGMVAKAGQILIAPGGAQMRVVKQAAETVLRITDDPPERNCKPSVDYLFRSIAEQFGGRAACAVLTGMGDDGAAGCALLKSNGARIIAQDEASCVVYGMPRAVVEAGLADEVVPLQDIAPQLMSAVGLGACI